MALVLGLWIEHLIGALLVKSDVYRAPAAILGTGARSRALASLLLSRRPVDCVHRIIDDAHAPTMSPMNSCRDMAPRYFRCGLGVFGTLDEWRAGGGAEVVIVPDCQLLPRDPAALYELGVRQVC